MKKIMYLAVVCALVVSCGGNKPQENGAENYNEQTDTIIITADSIDDVDTATVNIVSAEDYSIGKEEDIVPEEVVEVVQADANNSKYDGMLDEYESAANNLKSAANKVLSGNESAMNDVSKYGPKCDKLESKLNKAKKDLSPNQLDRFKKIKSIHYKAIGSVVG